ncbi:GNAT family N-acetyltransferase [Streptomyces sp. NPDC002755]|uniref:GNAT family N-acetyltransferase n=1 Tax=Streptomyces sp. NPDC002884 TaxID=3154544 RepID=UPI00332561F8
MTDQLRTGVVTVALAAPGDGPDAAALGSLALGTPVPEERAATAPLARAIDVHGGQVPLPYGQGRCLVARSGGLVTGMVYLTPPIRWLEDHPAAQRPALVTALVEIELLAVAESHRGQGIATALLNAAEETARDGGTHLSFAKVRRGDFAVMRWYRRRGYTIAAQTEPVLFRTRSGLESCDDGSDGYQLAAKPLQPGVVLRRRASHDSTMLIAERDT